MEIQVIEVYDYTHKIGRNWSSLTVCDVLVLVDITSKRTFPNGAINKLLE